MLDCCPLPDTDAPPTPTDALAELAQQLALTALYCRSWCAVSIAPGTVITVQQADPVTEAGPFHVLVDWQPAGGSVLPSDPDGLRLMLGAAFLEAARAVLQ